MAFVTNGQRVPEDIQVARADRLIRQAVELSEMMGDGPDEEYLAMAFRGINDYAHV